MHKQGTSWSQVNHSTSGPLHSPVLLYKQLNLINSKSLGLEILFRIMSSSNFREVLTPKNDIIISFFCQTLVLGG